MTDGPAVIEDLVIVASLVGLVTKEMDLLEAFILDMPQCIRLVPSTREDVEGDLTSDAVGEVVRLKLLLECFYEISSDLMLLVVCLKVVSLLHAVQSRQKLGAGRRRVVVTYLAFLPIGETLIMPFRNSIKVPLWGRKYAVSHFDRLRESEQMAHRLTGMSRSAM